MSLTITLHDHYSVHLDSRVHLSRIVTIRNNEGNQLKFSYVRRLGRHRLHNHVLRHSAIEARVRVVFAATGEASIQFFVRVYVWCFFDRNRQATGLFTDYVRPLQRVEVGTSRRIGIMRRVCSFC